MINEPSDDTCSVTFSIRLTPAQRNKIEQRARIAGTRPSAWVKDAIEFAFENMGTSDRKIAKETLLALVKSDPEVRRELGVAIYSLLNLEDVKTLLKQGEDSEKIADALGDFDLSKGYVRFTEGILSVTLTWDEKPMTPAEYEALVRTNKDFFILEEEKEGCLIFWNGLESPEVSTIVAGYPAGTCRIRHGVINHLDGIVKLNDRISNQIVAMIREVCWQKTGSSPGPRVAFRDKFCRPMLVQAGGISGLPASFTLDWQSENLREGKYPTVEDLVHAIQYGEDDTLHAVYTVKWPEMSDKLKNRMTEQP